MHCIMEKTDGKNWRSNIKRDLGKTLVTKVAEVKSARSLNESSNPNVMSRWRQIKHSQVPTMWLMSHTYSRARLTVECFFHNRKLLPTLSISTSRIVITDGATIVMNNIDKCMKYFILYIIVVFSRKTYIPYKVSFCHSY